MLFAAIGILTVIVGFGTAIVIMFGKSNRSFTVARFLKTNLLGILLSALLATALFFAIWPPVNEYSWLLLAAVLVFFSLTLFTGIAKAKKNKYIFIKQ